MNSEDIVFLVILLLQGSKTFSNSFLLYTVSLQGEMMSGAQPKD